MLIAPIEDIYEELLPTLAQHGVEDTTENRFHALTGLYDSWIEDGARDIPEARAWLLAVTIERLTLQNKMMVERIRSTMPNHTP